jgi:hypothetical protein
MHFCAGTPRTFLIFTSVPLDCTEHPEKIWGLAMPPLAVGAARLRPNRARPPALSAVQGRGEEGTLT